VSLAWTKEFSVGVGELDRHHQHLIAVFNKLYEAMTVGDDPKTVAEVLKELDDYAAYHFKAEKDLFRKKKYPAAAAHNRQHNEFREHLKRLHALVRKKDDYAGLEMAAFLSSWLTNHILTADMKYVPYLAD
jgi:hemerythrin